jgi:hypothetical protein
MDSFREFGGGFGLGFGFSLFATTQIFRWISLLSITLAKHGGDFLGEPKRRFLWACPFVSLLHPGFWLASLVFIVPWVLLTGELSPFTRGAAIGLLVHMSFFGAAFGIAAMRIRQKKVEAKRI